MRAKAIATAAVIALATAGAASAETWTDPAGRLTFENPSGWAVSTENMPGVTYVVTGTADNECHIIAIPRDQLASAAAADVRRAAGDDAQNTPEVWAQRGNAIPSIFPNSSANVLSRSSEQSTFWPIQRAEIQGPERLVHAAQSIRPGIEFQTYCQTYEGADPVAVYDSVIRSVAHPNDAAWQAQAEQQQAAREASGETNAEAPQAEEEQRRPRRQRGLTTGAQGNAPM